MNDSQEATACALCGAPTKLCRSHILPEFLFKSMYDDKNRLHLASALPDLPHRMSQSGFWQRLLCGSCESRISLWERYAERLLSGAIAPTARIEGRVLMLSGIDYQPMKLFLMSILWRSSVTSHRFFAHVSLGPHDERLRLMLLHDDPGDPRDYPCFASVLMHEGGPSGDVIVEPTRTKVFNRNGYRFVFGGHVWAFLVASDYNFPHVPAWFLQRDGTMPLLLGELTEAKFITELMERVHHMGRSPYQ